MKKLFSILGVIILICAVIVFYGCEGDREVKILPDDEGEYTEDKLPRITEVKGNGSESDIFIDMIIIQGTNFGEDPEVILISEERDWGQVWKLEKLTAGKRRKRGRRF